MRDIALFSIALLALFGCTEGECPLDESSRLAAYKNELDRVVTTGSSFVLFQSGEDFVQFAGGQHELILDVPNSMLWGEREQKLLSLLGSKAHRNEFDGGYSIQFSVRTTPEGAALAEAVFRDVYGLPADYPVNHIGTESYDTYPCG